MNVNLLNIVKRIKGREKPKINRRITVFLVCLFIAALFWFLNALSKNYNAIVSFPVIYKNLPEDKVLTRKLPESISIELNAQGFHILAYQYRFLKDTVYIDGSNLNLRDNNNGNYEAKLVTANRLPRIARQFSPEVRINRIFPDTLYFTFGSKKIREIPVKLNYSISYEKQHRLKDTVLFSPSLIKVEGLERIVDALEFFETDSLILTQINQSVTTEIPLKIPEKYSTLEITPTTVMVTVPVEKFTEASVEIPLEVVNLPENLTMKIFPEKISITYIVGFSDFDKVNAQMFSAKVDYNKKDNTNRLPVEISRQPEYVQILRHQPSKVEYLIRKK